MDVQTIRNVLLNRLVLSYALDWIFIAYVICNPEIQKKKKKKSEINPEKQQDYRYCRENMGKNGSCAPSFQPDRPRHFLSYKAGNSLIQYYYGIGIDRPRDYHGACGFDPDPWVDSG